MYSEMLLTERTLNSIPFYFIHFPSFAVLLTSFDQKIMGQVQRCLKNQCFILHTTQRVKFFEPRALEFCVSATLVFASLIKLKNILMRLKRYTN